MNKNSFNFRRFWQLLCQHFKESKKTNLLILSLVFFGTVVVLLFSTLWVSAPKNHWAEVLPVAPESIIALSALSNAAWIAVVVSFAFVCSVFANMSNRSGEIRYLTLPATNAEKWLSRVVYAVVVGVFLVLVCQNLAILFCTGIGWIFDVESLKVLMGMAYDSSIYQEAFKDTLPAALFSEAVSANVVTKFFGVAFMLFGGIAFRRTPWLYTALVLFGCSVLIIVAVTFGFAWLFNMKEIAQSIEASANPNMRVSQLIEDFIVPTMQIWKFVAPVLGIVFLWLSYRLFCRRQLAHKKIKFIR
ncbi:MAG: hypothetical protein IKS94_02550 [Prevotella sp.]|nr:hypothetical protein [Prevotella sp.]